MFGIVFLQLWQRLGMWAAGAALVASISASIGFAWSLVSEPTGLESLAGPDNVYQPIADLQDARQGAEGALLRYSTGLTTASVVRKRFHLLQEKFNSAAQLAGSERGSMLRNTPGYEHALGEVGEIIKHTSAAVSTLPEDHVGAHTSEVRGLVTSLDGLESPMDDVKRAAANAEQLRREAMTQTVTNKRRYLVIALVALGAMLIATLATLLALLRRKQALLAQEKKLTFQQEQAIEEVRQASIEAQKSARAKNAFLGTLGHELRTPLQSILSVTDVLANREFPDTDAIMVRRLALAAERLDSQMKDLTDYARLDAGRLALRPELFDPLELAESLIDDAREEAGRKGLALQLATAGESWPCRSDPARIRQILGNLLSNAIRYTDQGSVRVEMSVSQMVEGDRLTLNVSDTGPGIPRDAIDELFKPFVRLDESHTRVHEGAGIGLAIVRGLTELLGGWVKVDSDTGRGTTVHVSLPVEIVRQTLPAPGPLVHAPLQGKAVLIVDDTESARESLADTALAMLATVDVVSSGAEALEAIAESTYDVVLLDIQMPGMDGIEVARRIRRGVTMNRTVTIVGVSAYSTELLSPEDQAFFDAQLQKPVRAVQLATALRAIMVRERN
ncbi:hybrid sensor histidine kinase/response regulator [Paraburkholderia tropica]|uniref:hybrid sensor histidine kinase/response regulator n=1 Tax=Paraburkholderia tropica TaxID=92647 RepID=UPI001CC4BB5D|nr:hybrid sensor histidine kinase/response regulator [Paraburkholderia tropica]